MRVMTKADYARACGLSRARISQYVGAGMPVLPDGRVDADACDAWRDAYLDAAERARAEARSLRTRSADDLAEIRALDRERKRIELARLKGELIEVSAVQAALDRAFEGLTAWALSAWHDWSSDLAVMTDPARIAEWGQARMREKLGAVAREAENAARRRAA